MKSNKFLFTVFLLGIALTLCGLIFIRMEITSKAMGVVQYKNETIMFAPADAQVLAVLQEAGEQVQQGEAVLELSNPELELKINSIQSELVRTRADLKRAEMELDKQAITGSIPKLQIIDELIDVQKEYTRLSELVDENNKVSVEQNLISRKQYYLESMQNLKEQLALLENRQLQSWKQEGLETLNRELAQSSLDFLEREIALMEKKLSLLKKQAQELRIAAPFDGVVIDYYFDYENEMVKQGEKLFKFADPESGFQVKSWIPEKNIDLISPGLQVRMESRVYHSQIEGYLHGEVTSLSNRRDVTTPADTREAWYEVLVDVNSYPHPPVHGSRVELEIIIGKGSVIAAVLNRPLADREGEPAL